MEETITTIRETERLLRASEVASILNVSRSLAYRLMKQGDIPSIRINRVVRVRPSDLKVFIEENRIESKIYSILD
jgi:excisionase family DNA binding protein